jgi:hypothetical protein
MLDLATATSIAGRVLKEARYLDNRILIDDDSIAAWGRCFNGQKVFPTEALDAVHTHYRQPNAFPIKPGDIIAHCETQPVWSSVEHVQHFLDDCPRYPYSTAIEDYAGVRPPESDIPDTVPHDQRRQYRADELAEWINTYRDELVTAILNRKHKSVYA